MFYVINVIFPILLVSTLNNVVLVLPVECGEKMSVSVTTFLTLAVFMTLIKDSLPSNSDTVCYLTIYLATQLTLGGLAVVLTAVVVACHHKGVHVKDHPRCSSKAFKRLQKFLRLSLKDQLELASAFEEEKTEEDKATSQDGDLSVPVTRSSEWLKGSREDNGRHCV